MSGHAIKTAVCGLQQRGERDGSDGRSLSSPSIERIARECAVDQAQDAKRILILQFAGQSGLGKILVADRPREAIDSLGADRSGAAVAGGRIRPAVHHGVTDFNPGGKAVDDEPARLALQNGDEVGEGGKVGVGAVQGRGELAFERTRPARSAPRGCRSEPQACWGRRSSLASSGSRSSSPALDLKQHRRSTWTPAALGRSAARAFRPRRAASRPRHAGFVAL